VLHFVGIPKIFLVLHDVNFRPLRIGVPCCEPRFLYVIVFRKFFGCFWHNDGSGMAALLMVNT